MSKNQPPLKLDDLGSLINELTSDKSDQKAAVSSVQPQVPVAVRVPEKMAREKHLAELQKERDKSDELSDQVRSLQNQIGELQKKIDQLNAEASAVVSKKSELAEKESQLFGDLEFLQQESERIAALKAELAPLTDLKSEARKLRSAKTKLERKVGESEAAVQQLEQERDRLKGRLKLANTEIKALKGETDELKQELQATRSRLTKTSRGKMQIEAELEALRQSFDSEMLIRSFATVEWLVESGVENHGIAADHNITIAGDGPWDEGEISALLKRVGYRPVRASARGRGSNEVIVVGRDADCAVVEAHIASREGLPVKLFPQELFIASIACGSDPFDLIDGDGEDMEVPEFLTAFGQGHPVIEYLRGLLFPWPRLGYDEGELPPLEQVEHSPLVLLGYRVGRAKGLSARQRRDILKAAYHEDDLPRVDLPKRDCDEYMQSWGDASSRKRLRRMACHIAWLIRKNRKRDNWNQAVEEWSEDLEWLKKQIYNRMMRFDWPRI